MRYLTYTISFVLLLSFFSCDKEKNDNGQNYDLQCDEFIEIDESRYLNDLSTYSSIDTVILNGNCLEITIASSGCSSDNWDADLIDSEAIMESFPVQRQAKISFTNNELCLAYFTKTFSFDLQPIQISGSNSLILHIDDWEESILYEY